LKRESPAAARNREPIAAVLREVLPAEGIVLEIASGTGEHAVHFAERFPDLLWRPSDADPEALESIEAWAGQANLPNLLDPVRLDVREPVWPIGHADAILCINMVHVSPWRAAVELFRGSAWYLDPGAPLILYGPYRRAGVPTAPSNEAFDASLRSRNPEWGLRELDAFEAAAAEVGFRLDRLFEMPANNLTLVFRR
jgi:hypothetical protein